jgi:hypothetical protein
VSPAATPDSELLARREATVRAHMEREIAHDWDAVIATFVHSRYELMATGVVHDGEPAVREYFRAGRAVVPDNATRSSRFAMRATTPSSSSSGCSARRPAARGPATSPSAARMIVLFLFAPASDKLVCERVYWDSATTSRQLAS